MQDNWQWGEKGIRCLSALFGILLQVALRIRPMNEAEIEEGAAVIAHKVDEQVGLITGL